MDEENSGRVTEPAASGRSRRLLIPALVLLAAAAAVLYRQEPGSHPAGALNSADSSAATGQKLNTPAAVPVHAATVEQRDVPSLISGLGTVQPWNVVTVRSRIDGQIEKVNFTEGQLVHEGDVLLTLDPRFLTAARDQAKALIAKDQSALVSAKADLERTTALNKSGYSSRQTFDQQSAIVGQLTAQIEVDKAALQSAEVELSYTTIVSPITGRAGLRNVDAGNIVRAADQAGIVTIAQVDPIAVVFTAPETQLAQINEQILHGSLPVTAYSTDGKTALAEGTLEVVDNQIDEASGSIRLKAKFNNPAGALWPGLSVSTKLLVETLKNAVAVPEAAVQRGPNGLYAYTVSAEKKAEMREITVGQIQDGVAVINSGLTPGEQVVTSGHYRVQPGLSVSVTSDSDEQRSAAMPAAVR